MNQLCRVCGEPAAGFHFGAFTCEGCKSFFGRTYNNVSSLGECKNEGRCVINKKNRTTCKACRLRKCLVVGMSKSGSRYGRRSNWFKIHCLLQEQAVTFSTTLDHHSKSSLAVEEAKRALQGRESDSSQNTEAIVKQLTVKEEDSDTESPSLSSPESHMSDNSLESPRRTPTAFSLYPKLGALSPFLLHTTSALTSPTSPYSRLPFYPYLYPMLNNSTQEMAVASSPELTLSITTTQPTTPSPTQVPSSPSHLEAATNLSSPLFYAHHQGRETSRSPIATRSPSPATLSAEDLLKNPSLKALPSSFQVGESSVSKITIARNLMAPEKHPSPITRTDISQTPTHISQTPSHTPPSPKSEEEDSIEQDEPIDLSIKRSDNYSKMSDAHHISSTLQPQLFSYSMRVTAASITPKMEQEVSHPVDLSCRA